MVAGDWECWYTVSSVQGGVRNWASPGLRVRRELWTAAMGLDFAGGDG